MSAPEHDLANIYTFQTHPDYPALGPNTGFYWRTKKADPSYLQLYGAKKNLTGAVG
jgi:hypothetical protein